MKSDTLDDRESWKLARKYMQHIERHAILLRQRAGVGLLDRLDPRNVAGAFNIQFVQPHEVVGMQSAMLQTIATMDAQVWSGMGKILPNNTLLVILNPNMTVEREAVTIMEEVAHAYYNHPCTQIDLSSGFNQRSYNGDSEREAFWTAGAALLPSKAVALAIYRGQSVESIALAYGTSIELVEMRIKTLRLWPHHTANTITFRKAS